MTLYELLRELVNRSQWDGEALRRDAYDLIGKLELVNALGTITATLDASDHEHVPVKQYFISSDYPVQQVSNGWGTGKPGYNAYQEHCKICGNTVGPIVGLTSHPLQP